MTGERQSNAASSLRRRTSTDLSTPAHNLLAELAAVTDERNRLRRRVRELTVSRDAWKDQAKGWKWQAMH